MGYCDPKAIRNGKAWADQVNQPGFMGVKAPSELKPVVIGRISSPSLAAEAAKNGGKTGWPPGLLQDDSSGFSRWLSSRPDAREVVRRNGREDSTTLAPPMCQRHTETSATKKSGTKMFTSVWIATPESTCASQVMFHPEGALSPRNSFATVTFFKPEQNSPPHVSTDDACIYDHAYLVRLAQQAVEQYVG